MKNCYKIGRLQIEKDRLTNEIEQVRKATDNAKAQFENEKETVMSTYNKLEKSVVEYHSRLFGSEITNSNNRNRHGSGKIIPSTNLKNFAKLFERIRAQRK